MKEIFIYSRKARSGNFIDVQIKKCNDWCKKYNYTVAGVYTDPGVSGNSSPFDRDGFKELLNDLEDQAILVVDLSRISRNNELTLDVLKEFNKRGIELFTLNGPVDLKDQIRMGFTLNVIGKIMEEIEPVEEDQTESSVEDQIELLEEKAESLEEEIKSLKAEIKHLKRWQKGEN